MPALQQQTIRTQLENADSLSHQDLEILGCLFEARDYQKLEQHCLDLLEKAPSRISLYHMLGLAQSGQEKFEAAAKSYERFVPHNPNYADAHINLGIANQKLHRHPEAAACFERAINLLPGNAGVYNRLGQSLYHMQQWRKAQTQHKKAVELDPHNSDFLVHLAKAYLATSHFEKSIDCFRNANALEPNSVWLLIAYAQMLVTHQEHRDLPELLTFITQNFIEPRENFISADKPVIKQLKSELCSLAETLHTLDLGIIDKKTFFLLIEHLSDCIICSEELEVFLCSLRTALLDLHEQHAVLSCEEKIVLEVLAYQGQLNEYLWHQTESEKSRVCELKEDIIRQLHSDTTPDINEFYLLASYGPLFPIDDIRKWGLHFAKHTDDPAWSRFLNKMLVEPEQERTLAREIEVLTPIENEISRKVKAQYEQNPYPCWHRTGKPAYTISQKDKSHLDILIAGCGTGSHPIRVALQRPKDSVLAVDLSLSSLAYAKRKANELGIANIKFAQADILKLADLNSQFDTIECGGVLHHMEDPEAGLRALLKILKPDGSLKLGLYSELARQIVVKVRDIYNIQQAHLSIEDIRAFRSDLKLQHPELHKVLSKKYDFYASSSVRDLLLHVQEHRFTIPQIKALLDKYGLQFTGFIFPESKLIDSYKKAYPDDPSCLNLDNWHLLEMQNPRIFSRMYQFFCRRI